MTSTEIETITTDLELHKASIERVVRSELQRYLMNGATVVRVSDLAKKAVEEIGLERQPWRTTQFICQILEDEGHGTIGGKVFRIFRQGGASSKDNMGARTVKKSKSAAEEAPSPITKLPMETDLEHLVNTIFAEEHESRFVHIIAKRLTRMTLQRGRLVLALDLSKEDE